MAPEYHITLIVLLLCNVAGVAFAVRTRQIGLMALNLFASGALMLTLLAWVGKS